jgi:hypothetical protein
MPAKLLCDCWSVQTEPELFTFDLSQSLLQILTQGGKLRPEFVGRAVPVSGFDYRDVKVKNR